MRGRFVYQADYQDTIDVSSNGTYSNYKWSDGRKFTNSGTWTYDSLNGQVHFDNFSFLTDTLHLADSTFIPRGQWRTSVEARGEEVWIVKSTETRKGYFLKIDSIDRKKTD
jgi:hypothetical protein